MNRETVAKNYDKSIKTTQSWKKQRYKHMAGIQSFHKSTAGKRMHRNVARTLATRIRREGECLTLPLNTSEQRELLKVVSSYMTHILIQKEYHEIENLTDALDAFVFEKYAVEALHDIESKLIKGEDLGEHEIEMLLRLCSTSCLRQVLAEEEMELPLQITEYHDTLAMSKEIIHMLKVRDKK